MRDAVRCETTPVVRRRQGRYRGRNSRRRRRHGLCRADSPLHRRYPTRAPRMGLVAARDRVRVRLHAGLRPPAASLAAHRRSDTVACRCPPGDRLQGKCHLFGSPRVRLGHGHQLRLPAVSEARGDYRCDRSRPRCRRDIFDGGLHSGSGAGRPCVGERGQRRPRRDRRRRAPDGGGRLPRQPALAPEPGHAGTGAGAGASPRRTSPPEAHRRSSTVGCRRL